MFIFLEKSTLITENLSCCMTGNYRIFNDKMFKFDDLYRKVITKKADHSVSFLKHLNLNELS